MKYKSILIISMFASFAFSQKEKTLPSAEDTIFFIDLDGVVSDETINPLNFLGALGLLITHPTLLFNYGEIVKKRKELSEQHVDGATNIIFTILQWLEEEKKYTNMTQWTEYLTKAYVCPTPNKETLRIIKTLKEKGFTILFATNQDTTQFKLYRTKMLEQGYNLEKLFDGGISTRIHNQEPCTLHHNKDNMWHVTEHIKPHQEYFKAFQKLVLLHKPECTQKKCTLIFIDDIQHHAKTAQEEGIHGIHYRSADQLKKDLDDFGIKI